jgi:DNA-binding beta-propeller fold protein YncE
VNKSVSEKYEGFCGGSFARSRRWLGPYSPRWGCAVLESEQTRACPLSRAASAAAKIPRRRTPRIFQTRSKSFPTPLFCSLHVAFCICLAFGCSPEEQRSASVNSKFFSRVEIIGTRGTGIGEFNKPRSVAVDTSDNLYVVDMTGRVQKFSPGGAYLLQWQMPQTDKGKPKGMCRDGQGNIVVIEPHYSRVNHYSTEGKLLSQWGVEGTNLGQLGMPRAAVVNATGEIYVAEYTFSERVQRFSGAGGKFEGSFGRLGAEPGEFTRAEGLGIDAQQRIYVADSCNHRIEIFSPDGKFLRAHGKAGSGPGEFSYPYDVRVDSQGRQYVCEFGNSRLQIFDADDRLLEILGGAGGDPGQFSNPWAIALDSKGNLYVADSMNHRVQKFVRR